DRLKHDAEAFLLVGQGLRSNDMISNIPIGTDQNPRQALVLYDAGKRPNVPGLAVATDNAIGRVERGALFKGCSDLRLSGCSIFGMQALYPVFRGASEGCRVGAVESMHPLIPVQNAGLHVPVPKAHAARLDGKADTLVQKSQML